MVSTLMHLVWSATFSKILRIKNTARFLFLGIFLDFDFLLDFVYRRPIDHRDYFHNIFFIVAVFFAVWLWERKHKNGELLKSVSAAFSLHIFLDLFDGHGVPLFFPISSERILLSPIGQNYVFPLKLFWEGNLYFTMLSFAMMFAATYFYRNRLKSKASQT